MTSFFFLFIVPVWAEWGFILGGQMEAEQSQEFK